ncbi:TetR/AcrR family transcriptional regulator [Glutamicibacter sp. JL.03c]|uniref:TetR/AcrR family transcriptional regulator n=1 Tax=Glutamicibacter sp. JL.03c TaxID=2984842 RepID=UPI0021F73759|nr:TetR/AcrR family transcriptional regulator [Glutamicibacter sp. JL.03c]UYQ77410.1 TetR/AcrR family transcriptional regulator [Glutamicibacter sp. JL.03c]
MQLSAIQQVAVTCFAQRGFAATGIRELAAAVGLNSATLYHYVGGKEELLVGLIENCLDSMIAGAQRALSTSADPLRQLAMLVAFHVGFTASNPKTSRVADHEMRALAPENAARMQALRDAYERLFARTLEAGQAAGQLHAADLGIARLAIMEMGTGTSHWYRPTGRLTLPEVQLNFVTLVMRMLGVADEHPLDAGELPIPPSLASEPEPKD